MIQQDAMAAFRFGGGAAETVLHPLVAAGLILAVLAILTQSRTRAVTPFLLAYFTIPARQVIVVAGIHLTVFQILILAVLVKMVMQPPGFRFNIVDRLAMCWALLEFITFILQWQEAQAVVRALGELIVNLGGYLAIRFLIPDGETLRRACKVMALICVVQGICMMSELLTTQNVFAPVGGASTTIRDGHVRAEGSMGTLYAGAFAGAVIPIFLWLSGRRDSRMAGYAGIAGASAMVFASHASTAWLAYGGSLIALGFWPMRKNMRLVRWAIVTILTALHLVMNGPVWSLIEKIDLTGGSSSYHRYMLVDNCIRHFSDWWLIGYKYYGDWGFDMWDLCNQFVVAALTGGIVSLALFVGIYSKGFGALGSLRKSVNGDRAREWFLWCLGSSLFANVVASFGINYMYHLMMWFFLLLTLISVATSERTEAAVRPAAAANEEWFGTGHAEAGYAIPGYQL